MSVEQELKFQVPAPPFKNFWPFLHHKNYFMLWQQSQKCALLAAIDRNIH